ncbi:MAG: hypothetical protein AB7G28_20420 [Pirellulales bacterium]
MHSINSQTSFWYTIFRGLVAAMIVSVVGDCPAAGQGTNRGVTPECQKSIDRGTDWLIACMRPDGMLGPDLNQPADLSCTSIAGLALLSQGNTPLGGKNAQELRRIIDAVLIMVKWLPLQPREDRPITLVQRKIGFHADRFLAALFLSQALGDAEEADPEIRQALTKLVGEIGRAQGRDGTWGDESWAPVLGTVLGWESLRSAHSCGLEVNGSAQLAGDALLKKLQSKLDRRETWMHDFYKDASSIRVLYSLGYKNEPAFEKCVDRTLKFASEDDRPFTQAGGEEYLAFFLVTECMLHGNEPAWQDWYPTVSQKIMRVQNNDGSWSGHHCIVQRTFCTAAALLTLQATQYSLPISNL